MALSAVCSIFTVVLPSAWVCCGPLAFCQPWVRPVSTFKPPSPRPSGTNCTVANAAARPAACAACCAAMAATVLLSVCTERCNCCLARCCCANGGVMPGNPPPGRAAAACCAAPLAANQLELNAVAASALPATRHSAIACASGLSNHCAGSTERAASRRTDKEWVLRRAWRTSITTRSFSIGARGRRPSRTCCYDIGGWRGAGPNGCHTNFMIGE
ncbi:hypothetical protein D3C71_1595330 [compost metagenome]